MSFSVRNSRYLSLLKCLSLPLPPQSPLNADRLDRKALGRLSLAHHNAHTAISMRFHHRKAMATVNVVLSQGAI